MRYLFCFVLVRAKPGNCPALDPNTVGICVNMCEDDRDCSGAQKCCSNGCGQTCVNPTGMCCIRYLGQVICIEQ